MSSLLEEMDMTPMQKESVRMITTSGDLLLTVVNDVLDYSKLTTGNVEIQISRSSLQETLNAIVQAIQTKAKEKDVTVRTKFDVAVPEYLTTDCRRLQQILFNVLGTWIVCENDVRSVFFSYLGSCLYSKKATRSNSAPKRAWWNSMWKSVAKTKCRHLMTFTPIQLKCLMQQGSTM